MANPGSTGMARRKTLQILRILEHPVCLSQFPRQTNLLGPQLWALSGPFGPLCRSPRQNGDSTISVKERGGPLTTPSMSWKLHIFNPPLCLSQAPKTTKLLNPLHCALSARSCLQCRSACQDGDSTICVKERDVQLADRCAILAICIHPSHFAFFRGSLADLTRHC